MGSGASAAPTEVNAEIAKASDDELKTAFNELSEEQKAKVVAALEAAKKAEGNGSAEKEAAKAAEKPAGKAAADKPAELDARGKCDKIFEAFDADKDCFLNEEEISKLIMATSGATVEKEQYAGLCELLNCDESKGFAKDDLYKTYTEFKAGDIEDDYGMLHAPFLNEFFCKSVKRVVELGAEEPNEEERKKKLSEYFHNDLRPLLVKSFKVHDTSGNDVLEPAEALELFKNVMQFQVKMFRGLLVMTLQEQLVAEVQELEKDGANAEECAKISDTLLERVNKKLKAKTKALVQDFVAKKDEKTKAAFAVVDTSKDGRIQLSEFCAAFEPGNERNEEFKAALGVNDEALAADLDTVAESTMDECVQQLEGKCPVQ